MSGLFLLCSIAFSKPIPGHLINSPEEKVYLASAVIPMGWVNAVALFQHLMRRITHHYSGISPMVEWRRDAALWHERTTQPGGDAG